MGPAAARSDAAAEAAASRPRLTGVPESDSPHGRPTAGELLDAVREFLTDRVMPETDGQVSFHARVAANAVAIALRELQLGPIEAPDPTDVAAVARHVAAKLAVANPTHFDAPS